MTRTKKYPETSTFHYYNANPHNRIGADCVVRALCTAMDKSWETVVMELTEISIKTGYLLNDKGCFEKYLNKNGWVKCKQPKKYDNTKYTGKEFCKSLETFGIKDKKIIANIGCQHIVAIIDNKVNDIWDSTNGRIGNYWVKQE